MNRQGLEELAEAVAHDCSMFDQQACLAPHVYYLEEGGEVSPKEFCQALAKAMEVHQCEDAQGKDLLRERRPAINQLRATYEFRELKGEDVLLLASPHGTDWTVVYEKNPGIFSPSP